YAPHALSVCHLLLLFSLQAASPTPSYTLSLHDALPISQEAAAEHGGWDREGAAKYLDERMDAWFANAKKLRTGAFWHWRTRRPSDRKSTRLNSSHVSISYAVFCLKKKKKKKQNSTNKTE